MIKEIELGFTEEKLHGQSQAEHRSMYAFYDSSSSNEKLTVRGKNDILILWQ